MTVVLRNLFLRLALAAPVVAWCVLFAASVAQDEVPTVERSVTAVPAAEAETFMQDLGRSGLIVSQLKTRLQRGVQVFDIKAGYELIIEQGMLSGRQRRWLGVWVQRKAPPDRFKLPPGPLPVTGDLGTELEPLNRLMLDLLSKEQIPGATLAVLDRGQLVYERGFGWADPDAGQAMAPNALMRIASISKPLTAVAILQLEAAGKLSLDAPVLPLLAQHSEGFPTAQALRADPRWADIQVRHLLQHTAGFDREKSKDTMFELVTIAASLRLERPPNVNDIVRYRLQQPLDFAPGSEFQYSNVGYCLLGRIIEAVSQTSYEDFVRQHILIPSGMQQTRLGKTRLEQRGDREAVYVARNRRRIPLVFDLLKRPRTETQLVETPWGQWDLEVMDAHGGWVSTAGDLVRFAEAMSASEHSLLQEKSLQLMLQRPALPEQSTAPTWYGLGWNVRGLAEVRKSNLWHTGLLSGTSSLLVRRWDDCCWAVLFNCDRTKSEPPCTATIDGPMHGAVDQSLQLLPAQP